MNNAAPSRPEKQMIPFIVTLAFIIMITIIIVAYRTIRQERAEASLLDKPEKIDSYIRTPETTFSKVPETDFREWTEGDRPSLDKGIGAVRNAIMENKFGQGESIVRTLLVFYPDDVQVNHLTAQIFFGLGKYAEAEHYFRRTIDLSDTTALLLNELGLTLAKLNKFGEAEKNIRLSISMFPDFSIAYLNLATVYARSGRYSQANEAFRIAYEKIGPRVFRLADDPDLAPVRRSEVWRDLSQRKPAPDSIGGGRL